MKTGMDRRNFLKTAAVTGAGIGAGACSFDQEESPPSKGESVAGFRVAPIDEVRIAVIGVGARGPAHLRAFLKMEGTRITAICDTHEPAAVRAQKWCKEAGHGEPPLFTKGDYDYRRMLERDDIDLVVIATPWRWHTPMAVDAMNAGKHCAIEVPATVTLEESWQLVDAAEEKQRHCMMLENCCYGREELMVLNMCRLGIFGELTHGECAYIHDLRGQMRAVDRGTGSWRTDHHVNRNGNLYPTHGLGPVAQYMNINRGDRMDYLTSVSSPALGRAAYAKRVFKPEHPRNGANYICGDMNTTLIKTVKGRSIMVQHDTTSPRPYDRINLISGTRGTFRGYPARVHIEGREKGHNWQDIEKCHEEFDHPLWKKMKEKARGGGHGGMDFIMDWRLICCLRGGEPLDQDVYDGALWSAVGPLSEVSVANRSNSVDVPDFTRGRWKTMKPLGIVE